MKISVYQKSINALKRNRFVFFCALLMIFFTSLPYIFGYLITPDDRVFTGLITNIPDTAQYMAWLQSFTRNNLISNPLTPEYNAAVFFNLLWWSLAKVSLVLRLELIWVIQIYRVFSIFAFAFTLDWFIRLVQSEPKRQRGSFLVAYFGGGLGWIWVVEKYISERSDALFPADIYVIEANSFLASLSFNHFIISATLMLLVYGFFVLSYEENHWHYTLLACAAAIVLGWEHAYDILLLGLILSGFVLSRLLRDGWHWKPVISLFMVGITSIWPALYSLYITRTFPVWEAVLAQFDNADAWTPDPFHILILMGLPFIIAMLGYTGILPLKSHSTRRLFVRIWFLANLFIIYLPLNFQIHYLNGWQIPTAILAVDTFFGNMLPWLHKKLTGLGLIKETSWPRFANTLGISLLIFVTLINAYLLAWQLSVVKRLPHSSFLYKDEVAALNWLEENAQNDNIVLSYSELGQYIPSQTGARAFLAHWAMTKDLYKKQDMVRAFFQSKTSDIERMKILDEFGVDFVLMGIEERSLGDFDPDQSTYLEACFAAPQATVYCVRRSP